MVSGFATVVQLPAQAPQEPAVSGASSRSRTREPVSSPAPASVPSLGTSVIGPVVTQPAPP